MMRACSSIKFPSPITMGPASAMIRAFGWTTVLGPGTTKSWHDFCNLILQLINFSVYQAMSSYPKTIWRDGPYLWWHLPLFHFQHTPRLQQLFWHWNSVKTEDEREIQMLANTASYQICKPVSTTNDTQVAKLLQLLARHSVSDF